MQINVNQCKSTVNLVFSRVNLFIDQMIRVKVICDFYFMNPHKYILSDILLIICLLES